MAKRPRFLRRGIDHRLQASVSGGDFLCGRIFVGLHVVAVQTSSPATGTTLADLAGVVQHTFIHVIAAFLQYLVPIGLLIGAILGFIGQSRTKSLMGGTEANPKAISEMSWRDFARLAAERFRQRGFRVTGFGGGGPDGGSIWR